jgi:hypothetical protein
MFPASKSPTCRTALLLPIALRCILLVSLCECQLDSVPAGGSAKAGATEKQDSGETEQPERPKSKPKPRHDEQPDGGGQPADDRSSMPEADAGSELPARGSSQPDPPERNDAGSRDAGSPNAGPRDAGPRDAGARDAGASTPCDRCVASRCSRPLSDCNADDDCGRLVVCIDECGVDLDCGTDCVGRYSDGIARFRELIACESDACNSACGPGSERMGFR